MKIFTLLLFLMFTTVLSTQSVAQRRAANRQVSAVTIIQPTLIIEGNTVRIKNAQINSTLEIYNVLGVKVSSFKIDSDDKYITLNVPKGCYILKIQDLARKIAIK